MRSLQVLSQKDTVTILITDSGLGGLSVCAELERKLETTGVFKKVHLVFCNALPETNFGYNNIETLEEKAAIFSDVLEGVTRWYKPDVVMIACNTLSVVYPFTPFSKSATIPVVGIVEIGAEMIGDKMVKDTSALGVIFGTETTIASDAHRQLLQKNGIAVNRIITQACPELAGEIQSDAGSDMVKNMIDLYVADAVGTIHKGSDRRIIAGLCCTHYGYCKSQFSKSFAENGFINIEIVNPNDRMADLIMSLKPAHQITNSQIEVSVISRAIISPDEINSIGILLAHYPKTATALKSYLHKTDLFQFNKIIHD
jgi:glutamate racemase